jgi:hypothetical protein
MSVTQSQIQVDSIEAYDPVGPVVVSYGASIPSGQSISGSGGINVVGVITASEFSGNGAGLTGLPVATVGKVIAFTLIS